MSEFTWIDFKIKSTENSGKSDEVKTSLESTSHIPPKQIATGVAVIIGLFLVLYWAGKITSEQKSSVKMSPEPVTATEPLEAAPPDLESIPTEKPEEGSAEKKSSVIDPSVVSGVEKSEKSEKVWKCEKCDNVLKSAKHANSGTNTMEIAWKS